MRLLVLLLLTSLALPRTVFADDPEQLGPATLRVNVCTRVESNPARYALIPVHPSNLGPYIARGDRLYATASECPPQTVLFVPQGEVTRRAVPVMVEPLEAVGGAQGSVPGTEQDVPRWAIPVEVEVLPDQGATGGGEGAAPLDDEATRRGVPVETEVNLGLVESPAEAILPDAGTEGEDPGLAQAERVTKVVNARVPGIVPSALPQTGDLSTSSSGVVAGAMALAAGFWIRRRGRF